MTSPSAARRILIIGAGFGGACAAIALAKKRLSNTQITVINTTSYMHYHPALYRLATGGSRKEACLPLSDIFAGRDIHLVLDTVTAVDPSARTVTGKNGQYSYDELVLAPGSETATFGIPGIEEHAFSVHTSDECVVFKRHLHQVLRLIATDPAAGTIVVVGGGATGIETAGAIQAYAKRIVKEQGQDPALVKVQLAEALPRLLSNMHESIAAKVMKRLQSLGIDVLLNTAIAEVKPDALLLKNGEIKTKTVVWTAGVKPSSLLKTVPGLTLDKRGRATVDNHLEAVGCPHVYVIGDAAATQYTGMAQTAIEDAKFVADVLAAMASNQVVPSYHTKAPAYAIPAGPNWCAVKYGPLYFYGFIGWFIRRAADFIALWDVVPLFTALRMFFAYYDKKEIPSVN